MFPGKRRADPSSGLLAGRTLGTLRSDGGFTLVETLVTVALITIMVVPLGYVFYTSLTAASTNAGRQDAAALATSIVSRLEAAPYPQVGFTAAQLTSAISANPSYGTAAGGSPPQFTWAPNGAGGDSASSEQLVTVTTAASFQVGSKAFAPVITGIVTDGQRFAVTTHLFWASSKMPACSSNSSSSTTVTQAYVRALIIVSWGLGQRVEQDSNVYPGGQTAYHGPQYNSALVPAAPQPVTVAEAGITGAVKVTWPQPAGWNVGSGECFAVGWADTNQQVFSTGLLSNNVVVPGAGLNYTVEGLAPGGSYVFFVTAYSPDGVESTESGDSVSATAPSGPLITSVTPSHGAYAGGTTVTLSGSAFSTPSMQVQFVPVAQSPGPVWLTATCSSLTTCTVVSPPGSGFVSVVAETPTGPGNTEVTSPALAGDTFSYVPSVNSVTCPGGGSTCAAGTTVTVAGTNLVAGTTFTFGAAVGSPAATNVTCNAGGTSCTMTVPAGSGSVDVIASNPGGTSVARGQDEFTYA